MKRPGNSISLNCVEKCLLALDSKSERMVYHWILTIRGKIDPVKLNKAVLSAQSAHPVMRTILHCKNFRLFREIQDDFGEGVLSVQDLGELQDTDYERHLSAWINQPMNIREEFPLRVLLLRKNEVESSLVFTFHHSAADGLRTLLFIRKVIESYDNEVSGDPQAPKDIHILRRGNELLESAHSQRSTVEHYYMRMISSLFHRFSIALLSPPTRISHDKRGQWQEIRFCFETINPPELQQIESKSKSVGVTVNDILLAACFRTMEKWNRLHGKVSRKISIMVPVNIAPETFRQIVSNQVSFVSLSTKPKDRADLAKLLSRVSRDIAYMRKNGIAFSMIYFFYFCSRFPLPIMKAIAKFFMITRIYVDTILLTNLGVIWPKKSDAEGGETKIGDAEIITVNCVVPVVTPMGMGIYVGTYNKKLNVCLAYRTSSFSKEKAQRFLDLYVEEIKNYPVGAERP
jgi:NRPS condensation-like uncharacterized protein